MKKACFHNAKMLLLLLIAGCVSSRLLAQASVVVEYNPLYGVIEGVDLTGYVAYDVYLQFPTNTNTKVTAIGGGSLIDPNFTFSVSTDCNFFQYDNGAATSEGIDCSQIAVHPLLDWDSRITLGSYCNGSELPLYAVSSESAAIAAWEATAVPGNMFDGSTALNLSNTLWFRVPTDFPVGLDGENKIHIGRFTTCGNLCVKTGVQFFQNYNGPGTPFVTQVVEGCFNHPCLANPIDQTISVVQQGCTTTTQSLQLSNGGNGSVTYDLFNAQTNTLIQSFTSANGVLSTNGHVSGLYYFAAMDAVGCRDTTSVVQVLDFIPPQINLVEHDLNCYQDHSGSIEVSGVNGSGSLLETSSGSPLPHTLSNLSAGIYEVFISDVNGCLDSLTVNITEPSQMVANVLSYEGATCFDSPDGTMNYSYSGGVNPVNFTVESTGVNGSVTGQVSNLMGGADTLIFTDNHGCQLRMPYEVPAPTALQYVSTFNAPLCSEYTNGTATFVFQGGTGTLNVDFETGNYTILPQSITEYWLSNMGVGPIQMSVSDAAGCSRSFTLEVEPVNDPADISIEMSAIQESCFNRRDGSATAEVTNGATPITFQWNDNDAQTTSTASNLRGNRTYKVDVIDANGCVYKRSIKVPLLDGCFYVANAITPNGDGANDTWAIGGLEGYPNAKVSVVNRWGQVVFESTGYSSPWKGVGPNGALPAGDYYYIIVYDPSKDPLTGLLTLKYE